MYGLRPMRLGEIFDAAIAITRAHAGRTFGLAAGLFSALAAAQWIDLLAVDLSQSTTPSAWGLFFAGTGRESPWFWLLVAGAVLVLKPFVYDAVHHELVEADLTDAPRLLRTITPLALSGTVYALATLVASGLLILPGLAVALAGAVSQPAVVNERQGPIAALRRSYDLVRHDIGRVIGFTAALWAFRIGAGLAIALVLPGVLPYSLQPNSTRLLAVFLSVAIASVVWPVTLAARAVLFTDLRVRAESLDVDLLISEATQMVDGRSRWAPS